MQKHHRLALILGLLAWLAGPSLAGSCAAAKLCCQGRDSGCVIQKASPNAIIEGPRDKPCYCDHACVKLGDCCDDFNETCAVSDCSVSDWGQWTECDNKCGPGRQSRSRFVVRPERNGGKPCLETRQSLACENYDACRRRARHFQVEETSFSPAETTSDSNFASQVTKGHCAAFTILRVSRGCWRGRGSFHAAHSLVAGSRICLLFGDSSSPQVDRRYASLAGIGSWELLNSARLKHCHGKWIAEPQQPAWHNCSALACRDRPVLAFL